MAENNRYIVQVFVGALSSQYEALTVEASKQTSSDEIVCCIADKLCLNDVPGGPYELAEVVGDVEGGRECKERRLGANESPVAVMLLWPHNTSGQYYRFYLREKITEETWGENFSVDPQLIKDYFQRFLYQPKDREYPDLCQLPDLNEQTLLDNLRARFLAGYIYTYVGSILIAVNPFKFYPIYNPKYVKLYQNKRIGSSLPPHIFAVADAAYHSMLKEKRNQCIVISGESGSGKTESTNFLLHHLTALSQKGSYGSGVEQTILSAGPVLEAFGNAKTAHNNNSSRFGKFIQVNYKENGMVHGAVVQKYLLEKSRICSQGKNERNYHVFYYLLAGSSDVEKEQLHLLSVDKYNYLSRNGCCVVPGVDEEYEFSRLKQSMEMVGFTLDKQRRLFAVLSAVLLLGNVEFQPRKSYHNDESVAVRNPETVALISSLLRVKQETLLLALTAKRARASGETLVINYRMPEAIATRDAMAKCLYGALFDWIVMQVNHALLSKKDTLRDHQGNSIGVLDIFGFEDFGPSNSFEQLCINYANEHLQYYFNQHVFKYEQEEYRREGIRWTDIGFSDNTGCLQLIEGKPGGLLCVLDDQCNFPWASNETLLQKYNSVHEENPFYEKPQRREPAFIVRHYAGRVKYQVTNMREKNLDLMRQDVVGVLKNSMLAFVRELVGVDPVAVFRWAIVRAFFRGYFAFHEAGRKHRSSRVDGAARIPRPSIHSHNDSLIRQHRGATKARDPTRSDNESQRNLSKGAASARPSKQSRMYRGAMSRRSDEDDNHGDTDVMQRASQIVMKNKSFRPRDRAKKGLKNLQSVKTLAGRTGSAGATTSGKARKQPLTVAAQFQNSLHALMDTLNQANPFFIRCIKSNSDKIPNVFDEETVQRQLRYTGMLETVRIRQAGYNVRLTYEEFIQLYRILLPKGLLSSQADVRHFLAKLNLNRDDYQLGATKIFMRESEQTKLDFKLHQQIMASIIAIQRWFRALLERRRFLAMRRASTVIQLHCRQWLLHRVECVTRIQAWYRGARVRRWYVRLRCTVVAFQAHVRGRFLRERLPRIRRRASSLADKKLIKELPKQRSAEVILSPHPSLEQLRDLINDKLNLLLEDEEAEKARRLRVTQSLPLQRLENKREPNLLDSQPPLTYCKMKVSRTKDISDLTIKPSNMSNTHQREPAHMLEDSWGVGAVNKGNCQQPPVSSGKITPQDLANELIYLRLDENNLLADKNKIAEKDSDWSATSSEGFLSPNHVRRGSDVHSSTDSASNVSSTCRKTSPQSYRRSLSTTTLDGRSLLSLPPVRRDPRQQEQRTCSPTNTQLHGSRVIDISATHGRTAATVPEPPARSVRRTQRRPAEEVDSVSSNMHDRQRMSSDLVPDLDTSITKRNIPITVTMDSSLRRRNSDPAAGRLNLVPPVRRYPRSDPRHEDYIGTTGNGIFKIAGHRFRKVTRFNKGDVCMNCHDSLDAFVTPGQRCMDCKQLYHTKCIQNKSVMAMPCRTVDRRKYRKDINEAKFNLTGTSEFTDRTDKIISDGDELKQMQGFIAKKISQMDTLDKKQSEVDRVFKHALREFKDNLVETYSVVETRGSALKYKDLIANFYHVMDTVCQREGSTFPITMGVNAFRGFMDEFMNERHDLEKTRTKRKKDKKRKVDDPIQFAGHTFILSMINIPTECEICKNFFMWPIERSLICQTCKLTAHKKCYMKVVTECRKDNMTSSAAIVGALPAGGRSHLPPGVVCKRGKVFGVPLHELPTGGANIPIVIDRLFTTVEMTGLYTEGIYRKSGLSSKVRELKRILDECPEQGVERLDAYAVHVRASVLKSFFRDMPEPLLTFELYDDFIMAAQLSDPQDRAATLFAILKKLPKPNYDLVERLIFHLARVALREERNRMGANALAIVFAPCILRTSKVQPAQDSLHDIARQTLCIETVLMAKICEVRSTLEDISTLDEACDTAITRLSSIRTLNQSAAGERRVREPGRPEEEAMLVTHIDEIEREKAQLTSQLPALTRATSDDDLLSTDLDGECGSLDDLFTARQRQLHRQVSSDDPIMV